jgi:hypothetical protein
MYDIGIQCILWVTFVRDIVSSSIFGITIVILMSRIVHVYFDFYEISNILIIFFKKN